MITIKNLSKSFADHIIGSHVNTTFDKGQLHAITGPSGSGKTTLLDCIGLLEKPTTGSIDVDGHPLTGIGRAPANNTGEPVWATSSKTTLWSRTQRSPSICASPSAPDI